jgi:lipopolysaccharide/colanic/teichoic acid biosynthesis glycosyltransferase
MKRLFDLLASLAGLLLLSPLLLIAALLIKLESKGPILFKQNRIGKGFRSFWIYKFRTMVHQQPGTGRSITVGDDPRITKVGRWLRKTKIDELPQLLNVLKGDMSLVGPRPELPQYVELFRTDYAEILRIRPGITDLASLKYHDEAALLEQFEDPEAEYCARILPDKISLAKEYVRRSSLLFDLGLIVKTLPKLLGRGSMRIMPFRHTA